MSEISDNLKGFYGEFEGGSLRSPDRWKRWLAPYVVYMQLHTFPHNKGGGQGRTAFLKMLRLWRESLLNMEIKGLQLKSNHCRAKDRSGASNFFVATYTMKGRYHSPLPGLESRTHARDQRVEVPATDAVWLDTWGRIMYLENTIDTRPLLRVAG